MLYARRAGRTIGQSGPVRAHASRLARPENKKVLTMNDTCGPSGTDLSKCADLQSCLESKLQARSVGSILYRLTWKQRVTPSGRQICALRASKAPISDNAFISLGWPTPPTRDYKGGYMGGPDSGRQNIDGHLGRDGTTSGLADSELPERGPSDFGTTTLDGETSRRVESANWVGKRREFGGLADAPIGSGQPGQSRAEQRAISAGDGGSVPVDRTTYAPTLGRNPVDWLYCRDGKWRPVRPRSFPLAYETPARVGRLRAYGNAIDAETATQFIGAVMDVID